jgi:hypothetical protein
MRGLQPGFAYALIALMCLPAACSSTPAADELGHVTLALSPLEGAGWLRLRLYDGPVDAALEGDEIYDTGCLEVLSESYDLRNMPSGEGRTVVIEGFSAVGCPEGRRMALGLRGDITIPTGDPAPYYHVPIYAEPGLTPLPEALNISEATAVPVSYCDAPEDCAGLTEQEPACYKSVDTGEARYWCVPTCLSDGDCAGLHPNATCDQSTGWCMMFHPFPLNLSSPRAFGHAFPMPDGGVAFVGGFGSMAAGRLAPAPSFGERFDPVTGIFAPLGIEGNVPSFGLSGAAQLTDHRVVLAGGLTSVLLKWEGAGEAATWDTSNIGAGDLRDELVVWSPHTGTLTKNNLPARLLGPAVVAISPTDVLVLGGSTAEQGQDGLMPSDAIYRCAISETGDATCETAGFLSVPRGRVAATCTDSTCSKVLVIGGHGPDDVPVEVLRLEGEDIVSSVFELTPNTDGFFWPSLCGMTLVGGADVFRGVGGHHAVAFEVGATSVALTPLDATTDEDLNIAPAVAHTQDGACWVFGGVNGKGASSARVYTAQDGTWTESYLEESGALVDYLLHTPRYGAMAAEITQGPLSGSVVVGGGLTQAGGGAVSYVRGAEVLRP